MHTLSNFSSISFSSSERRAMIRSLASRGWPSLISRGSKGWKNKMEVCRGVGTLQVYINAINFITNNSVSFSNQKDIFAPNRSRFIYFLRVSYFKEKTHLYTQIMLRCNIWLSSVDLNKESVASGGKLNLLSSYKSDMKLSVWQYIFHFIQIDFQCHIFQRWKSWTTYYVFFYVYLSYH